MKKEINRRYNLDDDSDFNIFNHIDGIVEFIRYCGFSDSKEIYEIICGLDAFSDTDKKKLLEQFNQGRFEH